MFAGVRVQVSVQRWVKPPEGWSKFNVDGALTADRLASCGGVLRNEDGVWKMGFNRNLGDMNISNAFLVELFAVQTAMDLVISLDFPQVIIESDSQEVVDMLNNQDTSSHQNGQIAQSILQLKSVHGTIVIRHAPRGSNCLVDYLAKVGLSLPYRSHTFASPYGECHSLV